MSFVPMFESLQESPSSAIRTLRGRGRLTESNIREGLALVQRALLEADVSVEVAKDFVAKVSEQAVGETVLKSLDPHPPTRQHRPPGIGQPDGPGRPFAAPQARSDRAHALRPARLGQDDHLRQTWQVAPATRPQADARCGRLAAPAAIQQLQILGKQLGIPVYADLAAKDPVALCQIAVRQAKDTGVQVVILNTAGRLHVNEELMGQLTQIDRRIGPGQVFLVVNSMTGQDAVRAQRPSTRPWNSTA